ncbi:hypothetical protein WJU21_18450 [Emcibacter sp. SYSU 3D8]
MDYFAKLCVGLIVGLLVYFLYPRYNRARPITSAAFGLVGAALGAFLSYRIVALGGPYLTPASLATAAGGAAIFSLAYLSLSS